MPKIEHVTEVEDWEANRATIESLCRQSPNDSCNDCGASGTRWVSVNHGVFICIRCSGIHRSIGSHVTKVKSTNLDKWSLSEIAVMRQIGNARGKVLWESRLPRGQKALSGSEPERVVKSFIVQKYEQKAFAEEGWPSTLKRIYKAAGYKTGLKSLKGESSSKSALPSELRSVDETASSPDKKKSKKAKKIYGSFGALTVSAADHDSRRAAVLQHFGIDVGAVIESS